MFKSCVLEFYGCFIYRFFCHCFAFLLVIFGHFSPTILSHLLFFLGFWKAKSSLGRFVS